MKIIHNQHEIGARMKKVEELKAKGYDTSAFTTEIIADGTKFWETAKKVMANPPAKKYDVPTGTGTYTYPDGSTRYVPPTTYRPE